MRHIDYGLGVFDAGAFAPYPTANRSIWRRVYQDLLAARRSRRLRSAANGSTRSDRPSGLEETRSADLRRQGRAKPKPMSYTEQHLRRSRRSILAADSISGRIEQMVGRPRRACAQRGGRLFFLGVGGSAGNCAHAVNDFRKLAGFEAYAPTDNVSELTARTNDEGWDDRVRRVAARAAGCARKTRVFVFSVGGGSLEKNISPNLVRALQYAREIGAAIVGVVGRDGGYTAQGRRRLRRSCRRSTPTPSRRTPKLPGGGLAPAGVAPGSRRRDQMGIDARGDDRCRRPSFLDRDGVINRAVVRERASRIRRRRVEELEILPGVAEALCAL